MPDYIKISELPAASSVASTDQIELNQGGVSRSATLAMMGIPAGAIIDYAGAAAPTGWLLCDGSTKVRTTYPALFTAIGTTYNTGGEAGTDFRLPDLRGRVTAGPDSGGSNRLNTAITTGTSATPGATGGAQTHTLVTAELASHLHSVGDHSHSGSASQAIAYANAGTAWGYTTGTPGNAIGYDYNTGNMSAAANTGTQGSDTAHNNTQPTMILNKLIKT